MYVALEIVPEVFATPSGLIQDLMKKARTPHMRILDRRRHEPAHVGPVIPFLRDGLIDCARGTTYVLPMTSLMGKTMAAEYVIAELNDRNALYFNTLGGREIADTLQATLNTTVDSALLPQCLVAALGTTGVAGDYELPSLLMIDEVNAVDDDNKAFIEALFDGIHLDDGLTCVIVTDREEVAEALIALNQSKIRPFPGSAAEPWTAPNLPIWLRDVHWTRDELMKLIRDDFRTRLGDRLDNVFSEQFPADGQRPGDVWREVVLMIQRGEIN